jgi:hypothetical protein
MLTHETALFPCATGPARAGSRPLGLAAAVALLAGSSPAQSTERESVDSAGIQGNGSSEFPSISQDGRFVSFRSFSGNLVLGDTNFAPDVYVHDRQTGTTVRVSVASGGIQSNGSSTYSSLSADGRYVAFQSQATNLVPGDTNNVEDIFVHDLQTAVTERASVDSSGNEVNGKSSEPAISADGRYVAFYSFATNMVAGDTNGVRDVFVHDRQTGVTERVSVDSAGNQANNLSEFAVISGDGRYVAFDSTASNLVTGDTNGFRDIFVHDLQTGTTELLSVDSSGTQANHDSTDAYLSVDGRYLAFASFASNLFPGDTNASYDVFVHDRQTGTTECASLDSSRNLGNGNCGPSSVSDDGRFVAFDSSASNLVASDTNGQRDVFVHDRHTGITERASVDSAGNQANNTSQGAAMSADGRQVAFWSSASNLVLGDTNNVLDVFVRNRSVNPILAVYCTAGTSASGCQASMSAAGVASASASSGFTLSATSVEGAMDGLFFFGTNGKQALPWGNGTSYKCVVPPVTRCGLLQGSGTLGACDGASSQDLNALWCPSCPKSAKNPGAGAVVQAQLWYRDPQSTSNQTTSFSDALEFVVGF